MDRDQLDAHLQFFGELGVAGFRREPEWRRLHPAEMVIRCVEAARHSAEEVIGEASPELVERIARKHLEVLALAAAEEHGGSCP